MSATRLAVLGGGSFGTVIANLLAENGHQTTLWMRDQAQAQATTQSRCNTRYLPDFKLHDSLVITDDMAAAVADAEMVFVAIPSKAYRVVVEQLKPLIGKDVAIVSTTKGIDPTGFVLMTEILKEAFVNNAVGALSGPNLAKEMTDRQITGTVIASESNALCERVQDLMQSSYFRVYSNPDRYGVELAGALKNIYAIVSGMAGAIDVGQNTQSLLMTRALSEMCRFAAKLGADPMTFIGLAGVGDLMVTCSSPLSRNYRVGMQLGQGVSLDEATQSLGQVAEGVNTLGYVKHKADELGVYMPLASALYGILYQELSVTDAVGQMMGGAHNTDIDFPTGN